MEKKKYIYTYNKSCEVCNKLFQTQRYSTKICSDICIKIKLSKNKKYTDNQISLAIELKKQGLIMSVIVEQTGIKKPSLQKIFQENNIKLSDEDKKAALGRRWNDHNPLLDGKKACSKCKQYKPLSEFHKNNNRITGAVSACKECYKGFYETNREEIIDRNANYKKNNIEKYQEINKRYYENNKEMLIANANRWADANPEKRKEISKNYGKRNQREKNARTASYRARKKQAQPSWLTIEQLEEIKQVYINRPQGQCVDHIIPIGGENVCGLHVPWNLQYLPEYQNESKGNKFYDKIAGIGTCHQHIRKKETLIEDINNNMPVDSSIKEFDLNIEKFSKEHKDFIERYEWLGTTGYAPKWVFTARIRNTLGGVVIITEPNGYTSNKEGKIFEAQIARGATASWTPKNLGSKLIMFSCNWMVKNTTKRVFFGYSDHSAGEIGTIYQACNFNYLGNHFGSTIKYELNNGKSVNSRYFRKTSTLRHYAKELGIEWAPEWTKKNKYINRETIPKNILDILNKRGKTHQESCKQNAELPKGKYVIILGNSKRDKKTIESIYLPIFGEFVLYPKRK